MTAARPLLSLLGGTRGRDEISVRAEPRRETGAGGKGRPFLFHAKLAKRKEGREGPGRCTGLSSSILSCQRLFDGYNFIPLEFKK